MRFLNTLVAVTFAVGAALVAQSALAEDACRLLPMPISLPDIRISQSCKEARIDPKTGKPVTTEKDCTVTITGPKNEVLECLETACKAIIQYKEAEARAEHQKREDEIKMVHEKNEDCKRRLACYERVRIMCRDQARNDRREEDQCILRQGCR